MIAIKGTYDNGRIRLTEKAPAEKRYELMAARDENLRSPVPVIAPERIREMFQL